MEKSIILEMNDVALDIFKILSTRYKKLGLEVTPVQSRIIMALYSQNNLLCQRDIEANVPCNKSTLSAILNTMEKNGLITRQGSENDSRKKNIILTTKSLEIAEFLKEDNLRISKILGSNITEDEYIIFGQILEKIKTNMERI